MTLLKDLEFYITPQGEVMISDADGVRTYHQKDRDITDVIFSKIETDHPGAFAGLTELYAKSKPNAEWFRYRVCHRFVRCNFGKYDRINDVDTLGELKFEAVECKGLLNPSHLNSVKHWFYAIFFILFCPEFHP